MPKGRREIGSTWISGSSVHALYMKGFLTKHDLWDKFNGREKEKGLSDESLRSMEFGTRFEDAVAQFFMYKTGLKVKKMGDGLTAYWRKDLPYFICHPDRLGIGRDKKGRRFALEVKCVAPFAEGWGNEWTSEIPDYYYFQTQSYFACEVPCDVVYVACMKGNRVNIYEILPDTEVISDMVDRVRRTNDEFEHGIEPTPTDYTESVTYYSRRATKAEGTDADKDTLSLYDSLLEIHQKQKELEEAEKDLKSKVMPKMGESSALLKDGTRIFYWQHETRNKFDSEKLKKDHPSIDLDKYTTHSDITKFIVNYPKSKKKEG